MICLAALEAIITNCVKTLLISQVAFVRIPLRKRLTWVGVFTFVPHLKNYEKKVIV